MIEQVLERIGLSEKQAKVYLALLELGQATPQAIAQKTRLNRPTVYFVLEELASRGLVTQSERDKKLLFAVESPSQLNRLMKLEQSELESRMAEFTKVLPQLEALFNTTMERPKVKFYEGYEGQLAMREEAGRGSDTDIYSFTALDELMAAFPAYDQTQEKQRITSHRRSHVVYTHKDGPQADPDAKKAFRVRRYVPRAKYPFTGSVTVHPTAHKVYISIYRSSFLAVVIENEQVAKMFMAIWHLAWDAAAAYSKK